MNRTERFYKIDQMIQEHGSVPFAMFRERLEVSRATIKRDLEYMRNRLNAPIVWDRDARGYRFGEPERLGGQYELPGLWFSSQEIHALLTMQHLLATLEPGGLLGPHIRPLLARLNGLLGTAADTAEEIRKRVKIIAMARRTMAVDNFEKIGSALLRRRRVQISYRSRSKDEVTEREISPQRLVHYRDNWYLDAWCHQRNALRSFAVENIKEVHALDQPAAELADAELDAHFAASYGIFAGAPQNTAILRFTPERARWVADEQWYPEQQGRFLEDGSYELQIPYSVTHELVMDILKYGPDVEVVEPEGLREEVVARLQSALGRYGAR